MSTPQETEPPASAPARISPRRARKIAQKRQEALMALPHWLYYTLTQKRQLVFLHIPKTAGTSLREAMQASSEPSRLFYRRHDLRCATLRPRGRNWGVFTVMRNPFDWYVSKYTSKMRAPKDKPTKHYSRMEGNSWEDFIEEAVRCAKGPEGFAKWHQPFTEHSRQIAAHIDSRVGLFTVSFLYYCVPAWREVLAAPDPHEHLIRHFKSLCPLDHILRTESLEEDFRRMLERESLSALRVDFSKRARVGSEKRPVRDYYSTALSAEIHRRDRALFEIFGYAPVPG